MFVALLLTGAIQAQDSPTGLFNDDQADTDGNGDTNCASAAGVRRGIDTDGSFPA